LTNYSANKYLFVLALFSAFVFGCGAAPVKTKGTPLQVVSLSADRPSPQTATLSSIRWAADVKGGVGERTYSFWILEGKKEKMIQSGPSPSWEWMPRRKGTYRVKAAVRDSLGNAADSGWSGEFVIGSLLSEGSLIAVMPAENMTGMAVPLKEMKKSLVDAIKSRGIHILEEDALEKFMEIHRVRYTGGINRELGDVFRKETGTKAVLFVSLNQYDDANPPKIALTARLVSTGGNPAILWADGVDMAGDDAPGILGIGIIHDPRVLWKKALETILGSLADFLSGRKSGGMKDAEEAARVGEADNARFRPKNSYGIPLKPPDGRETVSIAILPFQNNSTRRNAGEIMTHLFAKRLSDEKNIEVIEPGVVRQSLLMSRTIMEGGLSLPQADLLHAMLNVDLVLTGIINEYKDYSGSWGAPEVDFSTRVFDTRKRQVVWTSNSHNRGDDWVYLFNIGKVNTAHRIASEMAREVVESLVGGDVQGK
jgi:hypothetical protein